MSAAAATAPPTWDEWHDVIDDLRARRDALPHTPGAHDAYNRSMEQEQSIFALMQGWACPEQAGVANEALQQHKGAAP